jgi:hypothetical protein
MPHSPFAHRSMSQKQISKQELKRRAEQSARDKANNAQKHNVPVKQKQKRTSNRRVEVRRQNAHLVPVNNIKLAHGALNTLAMAMSCPQITPPQRLPTLARSRTDVKHLWWLDSANQVPSLPTAYNCATIGRFDSPQMVAGTVTLAALTGDPVAPLFLSKTVALSVNGASPVYHHRVAWNDLFNGPASRTYGDANQWSEFVQLISQDRMSFSSPGFKITPGASSEVPIPPNQACSRYVSSSLLPDVATINVTSMLPSSFPAARSIEGRHYFWHSGGLIRTWWVTMNSAATQTPLDRLDLAIHYSVCRYLGGSEGEEIRDSNIARMTASQSATDAYVSAPAGWWRVVMDSVTLVPISAATGDIVHTAGLYIGWRTTSQIDGQGGGAVTLIVPVPNPSLKGASFLLDSARVTAAALLVTNATPGMYRGGTVYGARTTGTARQFYAMSLDQIKQAAGAAATGFKGRLEQGAYTFLEPGLETDMMDRSYLQVTSTGTSIAWPLVTLHPNAIQHVFLLVPPAFDLTTLPASLPATVYNAEFSIRADLHIEFTGDSQLCDLKITAATMQEYERATVALAAGSYFYENPAHLQDIWRWIQKTGRIAIQAGTSAASRALLQETARAATALLM